MRRVLRRRRRRVRVRRGRADAVAAGRTDDRWQVPARSADRQGRHGRGLRGGRPAAGAQRRGQDHAGPRVRRCQALRRFEREAQACARLTHPNIVTVFDFGAVGADGAFLVMELVQGRTLRHELERRGRRAGRGGGDVVRADVRCRRGRAPARRRSPRSQAGERPDRHDGAGGDVVKVLDFGLAKVRTAADEAGGLTHPGVVMGTAGYMAPEQLTGRRGRPPRRRLRARGDGGRGGHRGAAVQGTDPRRAPAGHPARKRDAHGRGRRTSAARSRSALGNRRRSCSPLLHNRGACRGVGSCTSRSVVHDGQCRHRDVVTSSSPACYRSFAESP